MTKSKSQRQKTASPRKGLPGWVQPQCNSRRSELRICAESEFVSAKHWEIIRRLEVKLGTPEGFELQSLASSLRNAVRGWNFDWRLMATQKSSSGQRILSLVNKLQHELGVLEGDGVTGVGQWIGAMEYHDIRLHEQLESVKATVTKWQALPSPVKRPGGANAARNFFIWYLANSFRHRYGRLLLDVVHACACAHFDSAIGLDRSAVSKIAR